MEVEEAGVVEAAAAVACISSRSRCSRSRSCTRRYMTAGLRRRREGHLHKCTCLSTCIRLRRMHTAAMLAVKEEVRVEEVMAAAMVAATAAVRAEAKVAVVTAAVVVVEARAAVARAAVARVEAARGEAARAVEVTGGVASAEATGGVTAAATAAEVRVVVKVAG